MNEFDFVTSVHGVVGELAVIVDSARAVPASSTRIAPDGLLPGSKNQLRS